MTREVGVKEVKEFVVRSEHSISSFGSFAYIGAICTSVLLNAVVASRAGILEICFAF